jgi:hypothetical protein
MKAKRKSAGDNWQFDGQTITVRIPNEEFCAARERLRA